MGWLERVIAAAPRGLGLNLRPDHLSATSTVLSGIHRDLRGRRWRIIVKVTAERIPGPARLPEPREAAARGE